MTVDASTIALSLISHTNVGKTTLARTLVGRDVGTVRDAQHVTAEATCYPLIETAECDRLVLWDTPGFGDSARLARRLAQQGQPIGWFLSQVWDRFRDRPFFLAQQAVRNVREQCDVVLYLVNGSERPADAGYLAHELAILEWIGKPVIALVNQTGRPRPRDDERAEEATWRDAFAAHPTVRAVTTLDAFARAWVQEIVLLELVAPLLPQEKRAAYRRLVDAWQARRRAQFDDAIVALAAPIALASCDREALPESAAGVGNAIRDLARSVGLATRSAQAARERASKALAQRLDERVRDATDRVIALYGLDGRAKGEVLARLASNAVIDAPISEGKAAMMGGVVSGALTGLAADIASGGLTFGAGMLTGALLGALGGAGVARGMNVARGKTGAALRWDARFLNALVGAALLRYLAVAHYGRGRGEWSESEYPPFWSALVDEIVQARGDALAEVWAMREPACDASAIEARLRPLLADAAREALDRLHPEALRDGVARPT